MSVSQIITFQLSNKKRTGLYLTLFLSLIVGIALLVLGHILTYGTGRFAVGMLGLVSLYVSGFCIYCVYQLIKIDFTGIVISNEGITDLSTGYRIGVILWKDIKQIKIMKDMSDLKRNYLVLIVENPNDYISREPTRVKKRSLTLKLHYYGSPICISNRALECSFDTLKTVVLDKYEQYKNPFAEEKQPSNE